MSGELEAFLARVYVDPAARRRFLDDPRGEALRAGLPVEVADMLADVDRVGLELASESYARKRAHASERHTRWGH